ncbi:MAG: protein kinase [Sandaracinaceae bacterium]|nr:protein kinase [Sandaracinaceae bacterium]
MSASAETEHGPESVDAKRPSLIGRVLHGKYRLDAEVGSGGMGVVMRGVHLVTGRAIAVKILRTSSAGGEHGSDPEIARRFLREARIAAVLDHPNVVGVLDCGETDDGLAYQVLDLLEGESLRDRLARGHLTVERTLAIMLPILHALEDAHARDIVHRDLKPANIFLAKNKHGRIVPTLLDFGIAKVRGAAREQVSNGAGLTPTTQAGMLIGTPAYMSPEQARSEPVTKLSDLFSVATVLFECITGKVPFEGFNPSVVMARVVLEEAPRAKGPDVPEGIADAIAHAHRRAPEERPVSASALAAELRAAARAAGIPLPTEGTSDCVDDDPDTTATLIHVPKTAPNRGRSSDASSSEPAAPVTPPAAARVVAPSASAAEAQKAAPATHDAPAAHEAPTAPAHAPVERSRAEPVAPTPSRAAMSTTTPEATSGTSTRPSPWLWAGLLSLVLLAIGLALGRAASTHDTSTSPSHEAPAVTTEAHDREGPSAPARSSEREAPATTSVAEPARAQPGAHDREPAIDVVADGATHPAGASPRSEAQGSSGTERPEGRDRTVRGSEGSTDARGAARTTDPARTAPTTATERPAAERGSAGARGDQGDPRIDPQREPQGDPQGLPEIRSW